MNCMVYCKTFITLILTLYTDSVLSCVPNGPTPSFPLPKFKWKIKPDPWFRTSSFTRIKSQISDCVCGKQLHTAQTEESDSTEISHNPGKVRFSEAAMEKEFPWQALIRVKLDGFSKNGGNGRNTSVYYCGGTVINDLFILTSCQCVLQNNPGEHPKDMKDKEAVVLPHQIKIWINVTNRSSIVEANALEVQKIIYHPKFPKESDADVALLKLKTKIKFSNESIIPVCLPFSTDINKKGQYKPGSKVVGWFSSGTEPTLRKVGISTVNCPKQTQDPDSFNYNNHICTPSYSTGNPKLLENVDSGSPLVQDSVNNMVFQLGILSRISAVNDTPSFRLLTRISSPEILSFIDHTSQMEGGFWCQAPVMNDVTISTTPVIPTSSSKISRSKTEFPILIPTEITSNQSTTETSNMQNGTSTNPIENGTTEIPIDNGTTVIPIDNGTTVIPIVNGTTVIPIDNGTTVIPIDNGTTVIPIDNDTTMIPIGNGTTDSTVIPIQNGTTMNPIQNGTTATSVENGTTSTSVGNGTTESTEIPSQNGTTLTSVGNGTTKIPDENGTTMTPIQNGTTASSAENGTTITSVQNGTTEIPIQNDTTITPIENGSPVTSIENSTVVTPIGNETTTTGIPDSSFKRTIDYRCECGRFTLEETGGISLGPNWQVLIIVTPLLNGAQKSYCSGSVINNLLVLTSASCVTKISQDDVVSPYSIEEIQVKASIYHVTDDEENDPNTEILTVDTIKVHPEYFLPRKQSVENPYDYNVALIKLKNPIDFVNNKAIRPVCLPDSQDTIEFDKEKSVTAIGWKTLQSEGDTTNSLVLYRRSIQVYTTEFCKKHTPGSLGPFICGEGPFQDTTDINSFWGGGISLNMSAPDTLMQIGVFSHKLTFLVKNEATHIGYYSNIMSYVPFIDYISHKMGAVWCKRTSELPYSRKAGLPRSWDNNLRNPVWPWNSVDPVSKANKSCGTDYDLKFCNCGRRGSTRNIRRGYTAIHFEFPWQVLLKITPKERNSTYPSRCSATIINSVILLTSANCVVNKEGRVVDTSLITAEFLAVDDFWKGPKASIEKIVVHPGYLENLDDSEITKEYDIALLKLEEPLAFKKKHYRPVCLPELREIISASGMVATKLGWHRVNTLKNRIFHRLFKDEIVMQDEIDCDSYFNSSSRTVCVDYSSSKLREDYDDDLGTGIFIPSAKGSHMMQIGILSFKISGDTRKSSFYIEFFTKIDAFLPFIYYYSREWKASWCQRTFSFA